MRMGLEVKAIYWETLCLIAYSPSHQNRIYTDLPLSLWSGLSELI